MDCTKSLRIVIALICACFAINPVFASSFDLDCDEVQSDGTKRHDSLHMMHFQIDEESKRWCQWECRTVSEIEPIVAISPSTITLADDPYSELGKSDSAGRRTFRLDRASAILTIEISATYGKRESRFTCAKEAFGNFKPYLTQDSRMTNSSSIFASKDRIPRMDAATVTGRVSFEVSLDTSGKAMHCNIITTSGSNRLDQHTCELVMTRGKFSPAKDRDGNAHDSKFISEVRWMP